MVDSCPNPLLASKETSRLMVSIEVVDLARLGSAKPSRSHRIFGLEVLLFFFVIFIYSLLFEQAEHPDVHIPRSSRCRCLAQSSYDPPFALAHLGFRRRTKAIEEPSFDLGRDCPVDSPSERRVSSCISLHVKSLSDGERDSCAAVALILGGCFWFFAIRFSLRRFGCKSDCERPFLMPRAVDFTHVLDPV
jgi:hypothetical protein